MAKVFERASALFVETLTLVDLSESSATELLDNSVAFVQNFLALKEHYFKLYYYSKQLFVIEIYLQ